MVAAVTLYLRTRLCTFAFTFIDFSRVLLLSQPLHHYILSERVINFSLYGSTQAHIFKNRNMKSFKYKLFFVLLEN